MEDKGYIHPPSSTHSTAKLTASLQSNNPCVNLWRIIAYPTNTVQVVLWYRSMASHRFVWLVLLTKHILKKYLLCDFSCYILICCATSHWLLRRIMHACCVTKSVSPGWSTFIWKNSPTSLARGCCVCSACVRAGMLGCRLHRAAASVAQLWSWRPAGGSLQPTWDLPEDSPPWMLLCKWRSRLSWWLENLLHFCSVCFHWLDGSLLSCAEDCRGSTLVNTLQSTQPEVISPSNLKASSKCNVDQK